MNYFNSMVARASGSGRWPANIRTTQRSSGVARAQRLIAGVIVLIGLGFTPIAHANVAANVNFVAGLVTAAPAGAAERQLAKGHDINTGDRIDTAANGRIQMRFTDGGLVSLMPNSTFSVDEYLNEELAGEEGSLVFSMLRGGMRTVTGSIGKTKHENYQLNTPVATLGIRGTEYVAVLSPPNTLRVHVGRGKVVITNDQGSLEVPAGQNAVVTLGAAPQLSDQEPMYLATAVGGDRLNAKGLVRHDPFLGPPLLDMDLSDEMLLEHATIVAGDGSSVPVPPNPPSGFLPNGSDYAIAGVVLTPHDGFWPWSQSRLEGVFDQTSGEIVTLEDLGAVPTKETLVQGYQTAGAATTEGYLSWGELTGPGTITVDGILMQSTSYVPYVVGLATDANFNPGGILSYSFQGVTAVRQLNGNDTGTLYQFDLKISNLGSTPLYDLDMSFTMNTAGTYTASQTNGSLVGNVTDFTLDTYSATMTGCAATCILDVSGFLAGPNAEQAGVSYTLNDNGDVYGGAAALKKN